MNTSDILHKRLILSSARMRFSPETQPIRDTAIDKIIEQNLLAANGSESFTVEEMEEQGIFCFADGTPAISHLDVSKSLTRLVQKGRITSSEELNKRKFRLSEQALQEIGEIQQLAEKRIEETVSRLFRNVDVPSAYSSPFLECLCMIFSRLGETYVRLLKGEIGHEEILSLPSVTRALHEVKKKYLLIDGQVLEAAIVSFLQDSNPEYDALKWNMAQNYYVAKALGLDPSGHLLSSQVFGDAQFYLDTNVVIPALESQARHHRSFKAFSTACHRLRIQLNVCQISIDELQRLIEYKREIIGKVADQIPAETAPKVQDMFFELYREQLAQNGAVDLDKLLARFLNPMEVLASSYGVNLIDDEWFIHAEHDPATEALVDRIRLESLARRGYQKRKQSSLHDALLLRWIQLERERVAPNTWLATLDRSLPGTLPETENGSTRPLAITLAALLQWISPITTHDDNEDEFAAIFAEAMKYQLLPQESFFELGDFLIFAEMEWSGKELPAEDVEESIRYLRVHAPSLDPSKPEDREKLAHELFKFFADPGRKHNQEVQRLEAKIEKIYEDGQAELEKMRNEILERDKRIEILERERSEQETSRKKESLKRSARIRAGFVVLFLLVFEVVVAYLASQYGEGTTAFQKTVNSWPFLSLGFPLALGLGWFILGKERISTLGWPFTKVLKGDE